MGNSRHRRQLAVQCWSWQAAHRRDQAYFPCGQPTEQVHNPLEIHLNVLDLVTPELWGSGVEELLLAAGVHCWTDGTFKLQGSRCAVVGHRSDQGPDKAASLAPPNHAELRTFQIVSEISG
jgi:hypothetical protein